MVDVVPYTSIYQLVVHLGYISPSIVKGHLQRPQGRATKVALRNVVDTKGSLLGARFHKHQW